MRTLALVAGFSAVSVMLLARQPAFDVVSIKPNKSVSPAMNNRFSPGRMMKT